MKKIYFVFWFLYFLIIYLPIGIVLTIITALTTIVGCKLGDHRKWGFYPGKWWSRALCWLTWCPVTVDGYENLKPGQSYVFAANHTSYYDVFLIYGYLNRSFKWIMRQQLRNIPFVGSACQAAGHLFINQKGGKQAMQCMERAEKILTNGVSVVIFPEGTRTPDGKVHGFKRGAFQIAKDMHLPIVPLSLSGGFSVLSRNSKIPVPGKMHLTIHPPVEYQPEDHEAELAQIEQIRQTVISGIQYE